MLICILRFLSYKKEGGKKEEKKREGKNQLTWCIIGMSLCLFRRQFVYLHIRINFLTIFQMVEI